MKSYKHILLMFSITCLLLSGCEDWLDVSPKSTLKKEDMLKTQTGYIDILQGVYLSLIEDGLYGRELTFGMMDALAQYWNNIPSVPQHRYRNVRTYNYQDANVKPMTDFIWRRMYTNIANLNVILDNIDKKPEIFTGNNYHRVKGEALALRGFLHFELLKLYAPSYSEETKNQPGIPYVTSFSNTRVPFSTMEQVYQKIEKDLSEGRALLKDFDVMGPNSTVTGTSNLQARKSLFNYYACTYALASINVYKRNSAKFMEYFNELTSVEAKQQIFFAGTAGQFYSNLTNEWVFQAHMVINIIREKYSNFFEFATANANDFITITLPRVLEIYEIGEGGAGDMRYLNWMTKLDNNEVNKYYLLAGITLFKIGELYLMAAEVLKDEDPVAALGYVNELRVRRNIPVLEPTADVAQAILKESLKEYVGEGKMFHFYKRNKYEYIPGYGSALSPEDYIFPIPDAELEFNPMN